MKNYVMVFDIPRELNATKIRVWRELQKIHAKKIQHSVWKSNKLDKLIEIATLVKKSKGKARILEEKLIFE